MGGRNGFRVFSLAVLFVAVSAIGVHAQSDSAAGQHLGRNAPARETSPDEHLAMPAFPSNWTQATVQSGSIEIYEYLPQGQSPTTWTDKITLEVHHDTYTLPVDIYQRRALGQMRENCDGVFEGNLQTGVNNGYPAAYWTLGCKRSRTGDYGETRYTKAIQGGVTLYLLSRSWRTPAYGDEGPPLPPQAIQEARDFLGSSVVCASGGVHPCPAGDKNPRP